MITNLNKYYLLFTLFDKHIYLEKARDDINDIAKNLKDDEKMVFLNSPYVASINGKYNKVFNNWLIFC